MGMLIKYAMIFANLLSIYTNLNQKLANLISIFTNLNRNANLLLIFANLMKSEQTLLNTRKPNTLVVEIKWNLLYLFALIMSSFLIQSLHCCESHVCFHTRNLIESAQTLNMRMGTKERLVAWQSG